MACVVVLRSDVSRFPSSSQKKSCEPSQFVSLFLAHNRNSPGAQRIAEKHSRQGDITDLDIIVAPLVEQLNAALLGQNLLGKDWEGGDLDVPVVGHVDCSEGFVG